MGTDLYQLSGAYIFTVFGQRGAWAGSSVGLARHYTRHLPLWLRLRFAGLTASSQCVRMSEDRVSISPREVLMSGVARGQGEGKRGKKYPKCCPCIVEFVGVSGGTIRGCARALLATSLAGLEDGADSTPAGYCVENSSKETPY